MDYRPVYRQWYDGDMEHLGSRIELARKVAGLSQRELAQRLGVDEKTVGRWERGENAPRGGHLRALAEATERSEEFFLEDTEPGGLTTVSIAGVPCTGPVEVLARILRELAEPGPEVLQTGEGALPNQRHSGIHELLRLHGSGELGSVYGIVLQPDEELGLRTYGRSGPAVDTVEKAIQVVMQWRGWRAQG